VGAEDILVDLPDPAVAADLECGFGRSPGAVPHQIVNGGRRKLG
jgi:hypothetical protein